MRSAKLFTLSGVLTVVLSTSCSSPKKLSSVTQAQEVSIPFSDGKYKSDKDFFRTKQVGKSPDLATAKKIALQNVKAEIASLRCFNR